jgi:uncharacterized membrane protein
VVGVDVRNDIVIDRPCDEVSGYAADPTNAPRWYTHVEAVEWLTTPPVEVGSRLSFVAHVLGSTLAYTYEITELVPGEKLVMRTSEGAFPMETTYTWQPLDGDRTRMTMRNAGEPNEFGRMATPLMTAAMQRASGKDLANLKKVLEDVSEAND